jgi:hypothetical protein
MKTAYLSIDMDYWDTAWIALKNLQHLFNEELYGLNPEQKIAVMNHQQLLPHVAANEADVLINLDTHSDLASIDSSIELNCGTWVSYVPWRSTGTYMWYHANDFDVGNCNWSRTWDAKCQWKKTKHVESPEDINLIDTFAEFDIIGVGLCLSPDYITDGLLEPIFRGIVKQYKIPYKSGRRNENYARQITPKQYAAEFKAKHSSQLTLPAC